MILNHTVEALTERRSCRAYRGEQISEEELSDIMHAAKYAPSAMGRQARHFTIIQNKLLLTDIEKAAHAAGSNEHPFYGAPTVIVLSAPKSSLHALEDTSCAIMNIMLAAHSYGIGSCFIACATNGLRNQSILPRLKLPQDYEPMNCVTIGYPSNHAPAPAERRTDDTNYIR